MPFEQIIEFITGPYCYPAFFILMIFCGMGFPLNSDLTLLFVGSLSGAGKLNASFLIPLAILGIGLGDSMAFLLGKYGGWKVLKMRPFSLILKKQRIWQAGRFIKKRGPVVVFLVRFLPGARTVTFFTSGLFKLSFKKFLGYNFSAVTILSTTLVMGGHFFIANLDEAKKQLPFVLGSMFILAGVLYLLSKFFVKKQMAENYSLSSYKSDLDPKRKAG